jgi:hypothetical protein
VLGLRGYLYLSNYQCIFLRHVCCKKNAWRIKKIVMNTSDKNLFLLGEVVETYDDQGRRIAKVCLQSQFVETVLEAGSEAHLGDKVMIEATLSIRNVKPCLTIQREDAH